MPTLLSCPCHPTLCRTESGSAGHIKEACSCYLKNSALAVGVGVVLDLDVSLPLLIR